jgi:adenylylsulfate kinase-like enzyme
MIYLYLLLGIIVLFAVVGTYDNTRKTAKNAEKTAKMIEAFIKSR